MKKYILLLLIVLLSSVGYAQRGELKQFTSEKPITTAVDSMQFTAQTLVGVHLTITSDSGTQTLLFRTDLDTNYRSLYPGEVFTYPNTAGRTLYRKAKSGTVNSRAWSD